MSMAAHDPLAQYRKKPLPFTQPVPQSGREEYVAFTSKNSISRLRIRSADAPINAPGYNILLNVVYDGLGTHFLLIYTILTVRVSGRNLQNVIFAIENEMADFIQEFDARRWTQPVDADAPFISSIDVELIEIPGGDSGKRK